MSKERSDKNTKTISLRAILHELSDPFDTNQAFEELRYFFDHRASKDGVGHDPRKAFGKAYRSPGELPDTHHTRTLVRNLIFLRALFPSKDVIALLRVDGQRMEKEERASKFGEAIHIAQIRHAATGYFLERRGEIERRLESGDFHCGDELAQGMFPIAKTKPNVMESKVAGSLDALGALFHLRMLEEADEREHGQAETIDGKATRALRLFELGCYMEAQTGIGKVLKEQPDNGVANYVAALLLLAESQMQSKAASETWFLAEANAGEGSGVVGDSLEEEAHSHRAEAAWRRVQALPLLIRALRNWPRFQGFNDHARYRQRGLCLMVRIAAECADGQGCEQGLGLHSLLHRCGVEVDLTEASALEKSMLELLKQEEEGRRGVFDPFDGASSDVEWLQLYWALDRGEYTRFAQKWLAGIRHHVSAEQLERVAGWSIFQRHLEINVPDFQERLELVRQLEVICRDQTSHTWTSVRNRMYEDEAKRLYDEGQLEPAMKCLEVVQPGFFSDTRHRDYGRIRILYDLCGEALDRGELDDAIRWLAAIPHVRKEVFDETAAELNRIDEDWNDYQDIFGNKEDILFGPGEWVGDEEGPPLLVALFNAGAAHPSLNGQQHEKLGKLRPILGIAPERY